MRKLLSKPQAGAPHHDASGGGGVEPSTSPVPLLYRPTGPQEAAYQAGVPIASLDKSPDRRSAVLAGRHVLKTVHVEGLEIREVLDLRARITAQSSPRPSSTVSIAEQLSIRDVKWGTGRNDACIFTACLRGKIFQYDLTRLGTRASGGSSSTATVDFIQTQEDSRQVNTLDINPHKDAYLLSGSQDGIVRCFDTRSLVPSRLGPTFKPMQAFKCNTDVRRVQWSPKEGFYFACCTEQGAILKWDIRKPAAPVLRITGHEKACTALSWHPDGEHLLSGGVDKKCHVWDLSKTADKRQKPKWTIGSPASVAAVAWRPGQWSATCRGLRAAQVAVSYDVSGPKRPGVHAAHVWDLARPTLPYRIVERAECSPSALLWKDQEFLWTAGEDGLFCQNDVTFAPRVLDRTAVSTLAFSSGGDVLTFLDERPPPPRPRVLASMHRDLPSATAAVAAAAAAAAAAAVSSSFGSDPANPTLSISRSDSEDDVVQGFLMPRRRHVRKRRASSAHRMSATPPPSHSVGGGDTSSTSSSSLTVSLEDALRATGTFRPQQIMAIGRIPSAARKDAYGYLAKVYLEALEDGLPRGVQSGAAPVPLPARVAAILDTYARAAENVSQYRLAQVWRILAFAMERLFRDRAEYHREQRLAGLGPHAAADAKGKIRAEALPSHAASRSTGGAPRNAEGPPASRTLPVRSLLAEEIESTSNMPTPLVRPVLGPGPDGSPSLGYLQHASYDSNGLPPDLHGFRLPPPARRPDDDLAHHPPRRRHLDSMPISEASQGSEASHASSIEGYDFYDTDAMAHAIDVPGAASRPAGPSSLPAGRPQAPRRTPSPEDSPALRAQFHRQDSTDSTGGRIFDISQASAEPEPEPEPDLADHTGASSARDHDHHREGEDDDVPADEAWNHRGRRQPGPTAAAAAAAAAASGSLSSSRLLHLNKALLSMEWSGSDLTSTTPGATQDTYYRTHSQDTESSSNSFSPALLHAHTRSAMQPVPAAAAAAATAASRRRRASLKQEDTTSEFPADSDDDDDDAARINDRDYLPWPHDPPFPFPPPKGRDGGPAPGFATSAAALHPYTLVERALAFEVRTSPLNASAMLLLLKPLVPDDVLDPLQARAVLRQHHARLMGMKLFLEAALLRKLCIRGWPSRGGSGSGSGNRSGSELAQWGTTYPSIIAPAQTNVSASYLCSGCKRPRELDHNNPDTVETLWRCERCASVMAPCAVCGHRDVSALGDETTSTPSTPDPVLSTWWYCVGCGHGGHLTCLERWHATSLSTGGDEAWAAGDPTTVADAPAAAGSAFSGGCCPLDGCGHACLPGAGQAEAMAKRSDELASAVREASSLSAAGAGRTSHGGGGSPGGDASRDRDRPVIGSGGSSGGGSSGAHDLLHVRADGHEVGQSRAVDMVRESLASRDVARVLSASASAGGGAGETRERERRKSVKFAGTDMR